MAGQHEQSSYTDAEVTALRRRVQVLEAEAGENEQMRQQLSEEYSFKKAVIEKAAEGLCVCNAIPDFPFVEFTVWNPRMQQLTGYTMDEINRTGWYQTMYQDPVIREKARQRMAEMREGEDLRNEHWQVTRADGERRDFSITTSLLKTNDGLVHALALIQDVTDEVMYRRQLESQVKRLEGLLPICSSCKKIRDEEGAWTELESYIREHSEADFSHGLCPDCGTRLYPGLVGDESEK